MITKFIRKRNVNTELPFSKEFARVEVHSNGSETFKFTKKRVSTPSGGGQYRRPDGTSLYLRPDGTSLYIRP
jgi:hypothetical protein